MLGVEDDRADGRSTQPGAAERFDACPECGSDRLIEQALWRVVRARLREVRVPDGLAIRLRLAIAAEQATTYDWLVGEIP